MQYNNKPDKNNKVVPSVIVNPFSSQSYYIYDNKAINEKGYWTKTSFDEGIRPVITVPISDLE